MCIVLIAIDAMHEWPLLLLANRDEFHARPSRSAEPWRDAADCLGGLDEVAGGSWLAVRNDGRFAAVTNLRTGIPAQAPRSRGELVRRFVIGAEDLETAARQALDGRDEFGPFNLLLGDADGVWLVEGQAARMQRLGAGLHVVSNGAFSARWPKTERLRERFRQANASGRRDDDSLLGLLQDEWQPADADLPETGVGLDLERVLAPVFIRGERYGTRASTVLMRHEDGSLHLRERSFGAGGIPTGEVAWQCLRDDGEWRLAGD